MARKKNVYKMFVYDVDGNLSKLANARDKVFYNGESGLDYDYETDSTAEFIKEVLNGKFCFIELKKGYEEVGTDDLIKYFTKQEIKEAGELINNEN